MPMLAGVGLLVVCCSSSSAAMMMMGGDDSAADTGAGVRVLAQVRMMWMKWMKLSFGMKKQLKMMPLVVV